MMSKNKEQKRENQKSLTRFQPVTRDKKPIIEVRLTRRLQFLKDNPPNSQPISIPTDEDVNLRAIPVEGKIITQETFLFPDYVEEANNDRILNQKYKPIKSPYYARPGGNPRTRSAFIDKHILSFDPSVALQKSTIVNTVSRNLGTHEPVKDANASILLSAMQGRSTNDVKPMESRRRLDNETINLCSESEKIIEVQTRIKNSLTNLFEHQFYGTEEFFEGSLIKGMKTGFCRIIYSSFIYKEGFFVNGLLEGEGTLKFPSGMIVTGVFKANVLISNIELFIENQHYSVEYFDGNYHNDKFHVNDKFVLFATFKNCEDINEYFGQIRVYFRNGFKLDSVFENGLLCENSDSLLYDKFGSVVEGRIRHGINAELNGIYAFRPFSDPENEYHMFFKGEGTVVRKHKK